MSEEADRREQHEAEELQIYLERLQEVVRGARAMLIPGNAIINIEELKDISDALVRLFPVVLQQSHEFLRQAQEDLERAKETSRQLLAEDEVVRRAYAERQRIEAQTVAYCQEQLLELQRQGQKVMLAAQNAYLGFESENKDNIA